MIGGNKRHTDTDIIVCKRKLEINKLYLQARKLTNLNIKLSGERGNQVLNDNLAPYARCFSHVDEIKGTL